METKTQENKIQAKDSEVLRLLNQIATDMIRKSDVDRLIEEAVAKATAALKADYEERMKAMAAEYEAKIAEIKVLKWTVLFIACGISIPGLYKYS